MDAIAIVLTLGAVALFAWLVYSVRALRGDVRDLAALFRDAHGKGYSDPSAPAVVTGSPVPVVRPAEPLPAPARALRAPPAPMPMSSAPSTFPASVLAPRPAPHAPPVRVGPPASTVAPTTVPKASTDRKVRPWDRPYRPTAEQAEAARAAHAEADEVEGDARATVQIPAPRMVLPAPPNVARALGARATLLGVSVAGEEPSGDRETDESLTRVWSVDKVEPTLVSAGSAPPASSRHPMAEVEPDLSPEVLARVDVLAAEQGLSRDDMLRRLTGQGITAEEKRRDGGKPGKGEG